jgi:K+-sensing histidine kinase KdpD
MGGVLLTIGALFIVELLATAGVRIPNPPAILLLTVVYSAFRGGFIPGLLSAGIAWLSFAYFFSIPGEPFRYTQENFWRVLVWATTMPVMVVLVSVLKKRADLLAGEQARPSAAEPSEKEIQKNLERLRVLHEIDMAITSTLDLASVLNLLLEKIDQVLPYPVAATVRLVNRERRELEPVACHNLDETVWKSEEWRAGRGPANIVLETKAPLMIENIQEDPRILDREFFTRYGLVSHLGVPLIAKGETLGVLGFYAKEGCQLRAHEVEFLSTLAGQAAIAIHNSRLYEETKRQAIELERANKDLEGKEKIQRLLKELSQDITSLDLDSLLKKLTEKVREVLNVDISVVRVTDDGVWRVLGISGIEPERLWSRGTASARGRSGWILKNQRPLLIPDITKTQEFPGGESLRQAGIRGYLGVPLFSREGEVSGVLSALTYQPRDFTQEEADLLQLLANGAAVAIENARLFDKARKHARELTALVKINKDVAALLNREILLPRIAEEARRILNVNGVSFRLIEGDWLVLVAHAGEDLQFRTKLRLGESISGKVVKENRPVASTNVLEDPAVIDEHREILRRGGYRSFLGVPLRLGNNVIGSINLYSKVEREFSPEEILLFTAFSDQAAIAIENARLFAELREANRAKSEFIAAMSHELRTPLNVTMGNASLISEGFLGEINEKQRYSLEKISSSSKMLLNLVNNVLTLARVDANKMSLEISTVDVGEIMALTRDYVEVLNRNNRLEVRWSVEEGLPSIATDALKLEEILQNLIGNAFKFTSQGSIEIRARDLKGKGQIEFAVADTGIGIKKEDLEKIFGEFHQLKEAHTGSYNGVGLGLSIVKRYLGLMQGEIRVESQPGKGSTFAFTLPHSVH